MSGISRPPRGDTTSYEDRKWKESVSAQVNALVAGGGSGAPTTASYLTLGADATLTNERILTAGTNISFVDLGPGSTLTINASGGSSTWTEVEVDFGSTPVWDKTFTITDAAVTSPAKKIIASPSGNVATGRVGNDLEWDNLLLGGLAGTGSFILTVLAIPGPIVGRRKIHYQVA